MCGKISVFFYKLLQN